LNSAHLLILASLLLLVVAFFLLALWTANRREKERLDRLIRDQYLTIEAVTRKDSLGEKLTEICQLVENQIPGTQCLVMLANQTKTALEGAAAPSLPDGFISDLGPVSIADGAGSCGTAAYRKRPVIVDDLTGDQRFDNCRPLMEKHGLNACWSYPIFTNHRELAGTFTLYLPEKRKPTRAELQVLERTRDLVGLIYEYARERLRREHNEQHYRSLFVHNPDAVFTLDLEGRFVQLNRAGCQIIQYEEHEVVGQNYEMVVPEEEQADTRKHFEAARAGQPQQYEITIHNRQGDKIFLDITNMPIYVNGEITGVHGQARNRTLERRNEDWLKILERGIEASSNGITIADATASGFPLVYVNPAFQRITGYSRDDVLGQNCWQLRGPDTNEKALDTIREALADFREVHTSILNYRKDGKAFWNDLYIAPVRNHRDQVTHFIGVQNDITNRVHEEEALAFQASHDSLTGLPNRVYLEAHLGGICQSQIEQDRLLYVMFIDLDGFKPVNDSLGHQFGDEILRQTASRLESSMPEGAILARFGGDEFVALIPGPEDRNQVAGIADTILDQFGQPFLNDGVEVTLSATIGITRTGETIGHPMVLIQQADMAMYRAKQLGGNTTQWFTSSLDRHVQNEVVLRQELQQALSNREFELFYQPIFDDHLHTLGAEALIRWNHPRRGYISPGEFIPLAERTGQVIAISEWVMEEACRQATRLQQAGLKKLSINLSPLQFHRHRLVDNLTRLTKEYQVPENFLCVEITENVFLNDPSEVISQLHRIRALGITVAIDDFGTGFSSLSYMRQMPVDVIKIDRTFVNGMSENRRDAAITKGTLAMCHELGMTVVGEGVETEAQFRLLVSYHCTRFQGYWYARPMAREDFLAFAKEHAEGRSPATPQA